MRNDEFVFEKRAIWRSIADETVRHGLNASHVRDLARLSGSEMPSICKRSDDGLSLTLHGGVTPPSASGAWMSQLGRVRNYPKFVKINTKNFLDAL